MSNKGPRMEMSMRQITTLSQDQELTLSQQLDDPTKDAIREASRLWEAKDHQFLSFKISDLQQLLNKQSAIANHMPALPAQGNQTPNKPIREGNVNIEFVKLSAEELHRIDPNEKVGGFVGDVMYIIDDVPAEYIPSVVMNLKCLSWISDKDASNITEALRLKELAPDDAQEQHWSAVLFDIIIAEQTFGTDSPEFSEYLKWRKKVERSDFFKSPVVDKFVRSRQSHKVFKSITHPLKRGYRSNKSWSLARGVSGNQPLEEMAADWGTSRVDLLYHRIVDNNNFEPNTLLELIKLIKSSKADSQKGIE